MTQQNATIYPLFSTPVYHVEDTGFRVPQSTIDNLIQLPRSDRGPGLTQDRLILRMPYLQDVKELLEYHLDKYTRLVCGFIEPFEITNSWAIINTGDVSHYQHQHPNSIFSGTLYLQAEQGASPINFHGKHRLTPEFNFTWGINEYNIYNSENWTVPVQTGTLTIFPSSLEHSVPPNASKEPRVCLAFNAFVRANFGDKCYASDIDLTGIKNYYDQRN